MDTALVELAKVAGGAGPLVLDAPPRPPWLEGEALGFRRSAQDGSAYIQLRFPFHDALCWRVRLEGTGGLEHSAYP